MPNMEDLERELRARAKAAGVSPEEFLRVSQDVWEDFAKTAPETLQRLAASIPDSRFLEAEKRVARKIALGARKTEGSF